MEIFKKDAFVHQPNSKYLYTTHGFTVLSSIIEGIYYFCYYIYIEVTVTMNFVAGFINFLIILKIVITIFFKNI